MALKRKRYPVGIQTFEEIIEGNYVYVDKTEYVYNLAHSDFKYVFLSRPRRFGKSLLVSTLKSYFEGKKDLFQGLAIEKLEEEWTKYPVLHFSLASAKYGEKEQLLSELNLKLRQYEKVYGREEGEVEPNQRLMGLIQRAYEQTGQQVVLLIDEYDAPLLDVIHKDERLVELRHVMRNFYSPIKDCDKYLRFFFLTGITKFSQLSIFSELNNLANISMAKGYEGICGITEEELLRDMSGDIEALAATLSRDIGTQVTASDAFAMLKKQYDGYHFTWPSPDIYNPFSLIKAFAFGELDNYWFGSGTPTFLVEILKKSEFTFESMANREVAKEEFDVAPDHMQTPLPLIYQSGYLTIKKREPFGGVYTLDFPNDEVRVSMAGSLLPNYIVPQSLPQSRVAISRLSALLNADRIDEAMTLLQTFFNAVPYFDNARSEGHFQSMFYVILVMLGIYADVEVRTHKGRLDMAVRTKSNIYIFEFKIDKDADSALRQISVKDYAARFALDNLPVTRIGVNFDSQSGEITDWKVD